MEPPADAADAPVETDTVAVPARSTRPVQRRRGAAQTVALPIDALPSETLPSETLPIDALPVDAARDAGTAAASSPPAPDPLAPAAASVDPASFNPPAAVMADTSTEDHVMDSVNTAETVIDKANGAAEQMADRGKAAFADMSGRAKVAMEKTGHVVEELGTFSKGNMEALVESSKIAVKGLETMGQEAAEFSRKQFESATAAMKTLAATRSPTEFMKLQGDFTRSLFDAMIANTARSTEMMLKLANDIAQPISNRVAIAAEKIKVSR